MAYCHDFVEIKKGKDMDKRSKIGLMCVVDNLIWAVIGALGMLIFLTEIDIVMKGIYGGILFVFACAYMWIIYMKATKELVVATPVENPSMKNVYIRKICLLNNEHNVLRQWDIEGKAGLLIGKNTKEEKVDIDLSDTALATLVSAQHALLNYTNGNWFIEDFDSEQGTMVKKASEMEMRYLNKAEPVQLDSGDYIYIGKTILQVR